MACSWLNFGLASIGFSRRHFDGDQSSDTPTKRDSRRGSLHIHRPTFLNTQTNITRFTFDVLRFQKDLPGVDIFVCTADPKLEPPLLVINTVLSVMAYDYPPEKLSVYLSDDGGSELTFFALLQAVHFAKYWLPFCRRFHIRPRSPAAFFSANAFEPHSQDLYAKVWFAIKVAQCYFLKLSSLVVIIQFIQNS